MPKGCLRGRMYGIYIPEHMCHGIHINREISDSGDLYRHVVDNLGGVARSVLQLNTPYDNDETSSLEVSHSKCNVIYVQLKYL